MPTDLESKSNNKYHINKKHKYQRNKTEDNYKFIPKKKSFNKTTRQILEKIELDPYEIEY